MEVNKKHIRLGGLNTSVMCRTILWQSVEFRKVLFMYLMFGSSIRSFGENIKYNIDKKNNGSFGKFIFYNR